MIERIRKPGATNTSPADKPEYFETKPVQVNLKNLLAGTEFNTRTKLDDDEIVKYADSIQMLSERLPGGTQFDIGDPEHNNGWDPILVTDDIVDDDIANSELVVLSGNHTVKALLLAPATKEDLSKHTVHIVTGVSREHKELCHYVASQTNSRHGVKLTGEDAIQTVLAFLGGLRFKIEADASVLESMEEAERIAYENDERPLLKKIGWPIRNITTVLGVSKYAVDAARKRIKDEHGLSWRSWYVMDSINRVKSQELAGEKDELDTSVKQFSFKVHGKWLNSKAVAMLKFSIGTKFLNDAIDNEKLVQEIVQHYDAGYDEDVISERVLELLEIAYPQKFTGFEELYDSSKPFSASKHALEYMTQRGHDLLVSKVGKKYLSDTERSFRLYRSVKTRYDDALDVVTEEVIGNDDVQLRSVFDDSVEVTEVGDEVDIDEVKADITEYVEGLVQEFAPSQYEKWVETYESNKPETDEPESETETETGTETGTGAAPKTSGGKTQDKLAGDIEYEKLRRERDEAQAKLDAQKKQQGEKGGKSNPKKSDDKPAKKSSSKVTMFDAINQYADVYNEVRNTVEPGKARARIETIKQVLARISIGIGSGFEAQIRQAHIESTKDLLAYAEKHLRDLPKRG